MVYGLTVQGVGFRCTMYTEHCIWRLTKSVVGAVPNCASVKGNIGPDCHDVLTEPERASGKNFGTAAR